MVEKTGTSIINKLIIGAWDEHNLEISHTSLIRSLATLTVWFKLSYDMKNKKSLQEELMSKSVNESVSDSPSDVSMDVGSVLSLGSAKEYDDFCSKGKHLC